MDSAIRGISIIYLKYPGKIVITSQNKNNTKKIERQITKELGNISKESIFLENRQARQLLSEEYFNSLRKGINSKNRNIYTSVNKEYTSIVDEKSFIQYETRHKISERLISRFFKLCRDGSKFKKEKMREKVQKGFPTLCSHNCFNLKKKAWNISKNNKKIMEKSRIFLKNIKKGKKFEEFFQDICEKRNLKCYRGKKAMRLLFPKKMEKLNHLKGIPDFFVKKSKQEKFYNEWNLEKDCFVEIKRGESRLSKDQKIKIAKLKNMDFAVYIFRGDPEDYYIEKR